MIKEMLPPEGTVHTWNILRKLYTATKIHARIMNYPKLNGHLVSSNEATWVIL